MLKQYNGLYNIDYKIQVIQCNECHLERCLGGKCSSMNCIIYCIIIMFPSFLIHEKTTFCYVMEGQKKINHLENLDLDM